MKFRKDINGLRAIAVIGVLLFHFNASWMPGGFAGVDVFFVISGFLMTGIIFRGIDQERFSILNFYVARANRIISALALLCLVLLVFGWFYLTPLEYRSLGKHAASSISFSSNFIYWSETGYFDAASHEKWLLHTWTLSVEWQFYIIYPLILVAMSKFLSIKTMKLTILVATVLAFIFCVYSTYKWPNASYFLLSARAWEMLIGGVAYLYPFTLQEKKKNFVEVIGLALVIGSYFLISAENAWPGYLALFPVLGSFLIIQAQCNDSIITSNIVFQKLGTWSYSIYLWHWPLVVVFYYQYDNNLIGIPLSLLMGAVSYYLIEKGEFNLKQLLLGFVLLLTPFIIFIKLSDINHSIAENIDTETLEFRYNYSNPSCNFRPYNIETKKQEENLSISAECYTPSGSKPSILIHGDSHAQHLYYGLKKQLSDKFQILQIASFSCRINDTEKESCMASNAFFNEKINKISPNILIISMRNDYEKVNWDTYIENIKDIDKVIILGPSPEINTNALIDKNRKLTTNYDYMVKTDEFMRDNDKLGNMSNVKYISMRELLCSDTKQCKFFVDDQLIYADESHFSRVGSVFVVDKIMSDSISHINKK